MKHANRKLSGALAWSPQVAMNRREIDEFLSGRWVARVATIGVDGYPHVYPFWYYWDGECLYFTATETRGSAESVLSVSQAVESAAAELQREVEGFLSRVAA